MLPKTVFGRVTLDDPHNYYLMRAHRESTRLLLIRPPRGAHLVNKTLNDTRVMNGRPIFKKFYTIVLKVQKNTNAIWYDTVVKV